jgi:hypothetical protein
LPKLFIEELVIIGASSLILWTGVRAALVIGYSNLKLLKLILLMCILLPNFYSYNSLPYSLSIPLFS